MHPVTILPPWLLELIRVVISEKSAYLNTLAKKDFVLYKGEGDVNVCATPLLRILQFCKPTDDGGLTALLHDQDHKILAYFNRESLVNYENLHWHRLTYKSVESILLIKRANLRFVTIPALQEKFGTLPGLTLEKGLGILILEITDVDSFLKEQITVGAKHDNALPYVYSDPEYIRICGEKPDTRDLEALIRYIEGDLLSDDDSLSNC